MNSIMPYHNINTGVDHKFTIYTATYGNSVFATIISQHLIEMQSPSVTMSGYLWQRGSDD